MPYLRAEPDPVSRPYPDVSRLEPDVVSRLDPVSRLEPDVARLEDPVVARLDPADSRLERAELQELTPLLMHESHTDLTLNIKI